MSSALNMKFKAVQKKVGQSAKARPWKLPVVFIVALAWMLLLAIFEMLKAFFEEDKDAPHAEKMADLKFAQNNHGGERGASLDLYARVPGEYGYGDPLSPPPDEEYR